MRNFGGLDKIDKITYDELMDMRTSEEIKEFITWLSAGKLQEVYKEAYSREHLYIAIAIKEEVKRKEDQRLMDSADR